MKKNDCIVAFNGCIGLSISFGIPLVIHYIENISHKYYFPSEIFYLECLSYLMLMLSIVPDIVFSCQNFSQAIKGLLPLTLISPPLLYASLNLVLPSLKHSYFLEALFPLCITLSYLFHELIWKRRFFRPQMVVAHSKADLECQHCKIYFSSEKAFCPNCQTISPKVIESYNKYPEKHYLDFAEDVIDIEHVRCPHCKTRKRGSSSWSPRQINYPFFRCRICNEFYTDRSCYEWSVISTFRKTQFCLIGDIWPIYFIFGLYLCYGISNQSIILAVVVFISLITIRILWIKLIVSFDIRESKARLKMNPNYPQLLSNMGYEILDDKYKHPDRKSRK